MITAGVNEKSGGATDRSDPAGRLQLLDTNAAIYREIVPQIVAAAPEAVILVVTDPPDPLADLARRLAGHDRVLSTGTYLDSLRFRVHLAEALDVDPASVEAQVLGEHGTSEVFVWSGARIAGVPARDVFTQRGLSAEEMRRSRRAGRPLRQHHHHRRQQRQPVRHRHGVGANRRDGAARRSRGHSDRLLPANRYGVTLSLPCVVGRGGVSARLEPRLSAEEQQALRRSAETLKKAVSRIAR